MCLGMHFTIKDEQSVCTKLSSQKCPIKSEGRPPGLQVFCASYSTCLVLLGMKDPCRDLARTWMVFGRSYKIFEEMDEDLTRSSSGSTRILMNIFKDL